jgi:hypothetical protein
MSSDPLYSKGAVASQRLRILLTVDEGARFENRRMCSQGVRQRAVSFILSGVQSQGITILDVLSQLCSKARCYFRPLNVSHNDPAAKKHSKHLLVLTLAARLDSTTNLLTKPHQCCCPINVTRPAHALNIAPSNLEFILLLCFPKNQGRANYIASQKPPNCRVNSNS